MELQNTSQGEVASSSVENNGSVAAEPQETKVDYWEEAKEVFDEPDLVTDEPVEDKGSVESHVEENTSDNKSDDLNLDLLRVPPKYKGRIKEFVEPILQERQKQVEAISESLGQHQESVFGLVNIFQEIARDPNKLIDYVAEHGELIGLEPEVIEHYSQLKTGGNTGQRQEQPTANQDQQQVAKQIAIDAIVDKYAEALISTQDPRHFVSVLKQQNMEIAQAVEQKILGSMGKLLKAYHDNMIAPDKETLKQFKSKAEEDAHIARFETTRNAWNSALSKTKEKFQDFDKYEAKIRQRLKEDPNFSELRMSINKDPKNIERRAALLEQIYKLESREDHISRLNSPKPKQTGLNPNSKHISTKNSGPVSWDDIKEEFFS